jgi:hypothetical protein
MSWPESPAWLLRLQAQLGDALRTPLSREGGVLAATTGDYDPRLLDALGDQPGSSAAERLGIYQRQYWARLFTTLQRAFPLTAQLMSYWSFNELAARHLLDQPPRDFDLESIGQGFEARLARELRGGFQPQRAVPVEALMDAARIDAAFQRVLRAPLTPPFVPTAEDVPRLSACRLTLSPAAALIAEHWPLCELRAVAGPDASPAALGERAHAAQHWLLLRRGATELRRLPLEPLEAELLQLLTEQPLAQALAELEIRAGAEHRSSLPGRAQAWLAKSVELGVWSGLSP